MSLSSLGMEEGACNNDVIEGYFAEVSTPDRLELFIRASQNFYTFEIDLPMQTNVSSTVKGPFITDLTWYLKTNTLIAIAYFMSAGLALLFSIPPDHFAPFFIPAGISLAVCVSFGHRVLPGIILGAFCFNVYTSIVLRSAEGHFLLMMIAACAVSGGSALQAWVGARLFTRFSDQKLASGTSIIFFLLIVPISSLIAASIGILSFWKLGLVSQENLAPNWLIWWFGDTVGAVLGAALTWILVGRPRALWRRRFWLLGIPLLLTSFGFLALYSGVRGWEEERRRYAFAINAQQVGDLVQFQFEEHERFLFLAAQAINESDINSQEKFSRLARGYLENRPELRLLSMARLVAEREKGDFELWARANLSANFSIKSTSAIKASANGQTAPPASKEFFPTIFVEPMHNNEAILGMDLLSESVRADMVRRALDRKTGAASAPIQLLQSGNNSPAILLGQRLELRFPERLSTNRGVLVVVIEIEPYIGKTLARAGFSGYSMQMFDIDAAKTQLLPEKAFLHKDALSFQKTIQLGDRHYQLTIQDPNARRALADWGSWTMLTTGLLLAALLGAFLLLLSGQNQATEEVNAELSTALNKLKSAQLKLVQTAKLASLGSMVAGIAHELNTPIGNSVLTASGLAYQTNALAHAIEAGAMKRSSLSQYLDSALSACNLISRNLQRASELVSEFKQIAVNQNNEVRQRFSLALLVSETISVFYPRLHQASLEVRTEIPESLQLNSYQAPISQILHSLFENALLHAFENKKEGVIQISCHRDLKMEGWITLSFADNGEGIDPDKLEMIFDPFFTTKMASGNVGLGLAIANNLAVGVLGGELEVSSKPGVETIFLLHIPVDAPLNSKI